MLFFKYNWTELSVQADFAVFESPDSSETHAFFQIENVQLNVISQFDSIQKCIEDAQTKLEILKDSKAVFKRYFVSDAINQHAFTPTNDDAAISIVQQAPLSGAKVSVWVYWVANSSLCKQADNTTVLQRPAYKHLYSSQLNSSTGNEEAQTDYIFSHYTQLLENQQLSLRDNCIRTWLYVQGVDIHYAGLVTARKKYFEAEGLSADTHYIASTGIEGRYINPENLILMDAYAIDGVKQEQITYLQGLSHLNPTIEYGVTFERATAVDYGDRRHIYVSGTASIDNKGDIVHLLNIEKQIDRTLENIQVLLAEGEAEMTDIAQMIVYLRDSADYEIVSNRLNKLYPEIPKVIVWAPVCRPGWLIEIECIAIVQKETPDYPTF